jgi:photosystem II stability/assembly factor-like uncharacterized protein
MKKSLVLLAIVSALVVLGFLVPGMAGSGQATPSQRVFTGLAFGGEGVFAVGEAGAIRVSDNNADSWQVVSSGVEHTLTAIEFVTEKQGWVTGHNGIVLQTLNGGRSWQPVQVAGEDHPNLALMDVTFGKDQQGLIVGEDNLILATRDGGDSWSREVYEAGRFSSIHNAALLLDSGHALIATSAGEMLVRLPGEREWNRVHGPGRKALLGMIDLGSGRVLAFGSHGLILETADAGATWNEVKTTSSANYLAGAHLGDGSVLLVGSEGMVVRRHAGEAMFLQDEHLPPGTLTGVVEGQNGRLLVTGAQGTGFLADNDYHFAGTDKANPYTGYLLTKALLHRPEVVRLLDLNTSSFRRSFGDAPKDQASWVSVNVSARSEADDVLTPAVFNDIHQLHEALAEQRLQGKLGLLGVMSLWSDSQTHIVLDRSTGTHHPVVSRSRDYSDEERPYLERRIFQSGLAGNVVSENFRSMTLQAEVDSSEEVDGNAPSALVSFFKDYQNSFDAQSPAYTVDKLEYVSLQKLYGTLPGAETGSEHQDTPTQYLYEIALKTADSHRCSTEEALRLSADLENHLSGESLDGELLSVAKLFKYNQVARHDGNWKWFSADGYQQWYSRGVHLLWEHSSCVNPLALVIGKHGAKDESGRISEMLGQFEEAKALAETDKSLNLNVYRLDRTAVTMH